MRQYAVRMFIDGKFYRLATDRLSIDESGESQDYLPLLLEVEEATSEAAIEGDPPVPSYRIRTWDGARRLVEDFQNINYERVECDVFIIENEAIQYSFRGYMTDVSKDSSLEFTVRGDDNFGHDDVVEEFEVETFQYTQIMTPYDADVILSLKRQDVPWVMEDGTLGRYTLDTDNESVDSHDWVPYDPANLPTGYAGYAANLLGGRFDTYDEFGVVWDVTNGFEGYSLPFFHHPAAQPAIIDGGTLERHYFGYLKDILIENLTTNAIARLNGYVWTDDPTTNNVIGLEHGALTNSSGSSTLFATGDNYLIRKIEHNHQLLNDSGSPIVIKRGGQLKNVRTNASNKVEKVRVAAPWNKYTEWNFHVFNRWFQPTTSSPIFEGDHETQGYAVIGAPSDPIQIVFRYNFLDVDEDGVSLWIDPTNPEDPIDMDDEVVRNFITSSPRPQVRPLVQENGAWVIPKDVLFMRHNNYLPFDEDGGDNPTGLISLGRTYDKELGGTGVEYISREIHEVYRYKAYKEWLGMDDAGPVEGADIFNLAGVMALEIHSQSRIPSDGDYNFSGNTVAPHEDIIDIEGVNFPLPFPNQLEMGNPITLFTTEWIVSSLSFRVDNFNFYMDEDLSQFVQTGDGTYRIPRFSDRVRGRRFDMLMPLSELVNQRIDNNFRSMEEAELNEQILKQANEKFAVCERSEVVIDGTVSADWEEIVYFSVPNHGGDVIKMLQSEEGNVHPTHGGTNDTKFSNTMTFPTTLENNAPWWDPLVTYSRNARKFFVSSRYRVLRNPVPENPKDLGKMFPIVYGHAEKVPLLHVMGTKVSNHKDMTAGDDVYIFSANRCDVNDPSEIDVYLGEDFEPDFMEEVSKYNIDMVESPFPKIADGPHWSMISVEEEGHDGVLREVRKPYKYSTYLNPYHRLETMETREGNKVFGIKLSGKNWHSGLGRLDKRYPVRYGLGSTSLFGSFSGTVDQEGRFTDHGSPLTHPLDILRHYVAIHGEYPYSIDRIDEKSVEKVKSLTRKYEAVVYINDPSMDTAKLISAICEQFGFWRVNYNGQIRFALMDVDDVNYSKAIMHNLNIGNIVSEVSGGYSDLYNEIVYRYRKDWIQDGWKNRIRLDKDNNEYCRLVSKVKGQLATKEVNALFVNSPAVARDVVNRVAKIWCSKQIVYSFDAKYVDEFDLIPGEMVPMTYPPFNMYNEPVFVKSVRPMREKMEVQVVRFPTLNLGEPGEEAFEPSSDYTCDLFVDLGPPLTSSTSVDSTVLAEGEILRYVYSGSLDNSVRKIDHDGVEVWWFGASNYVLDTAVDPDEYVYVATYQDNTVRKISPTGTEVWSFAGHTSHVWGVAVDPEGYVYSASADNTVRKISRTGTEVWSFTGHTSTVYAVAVDADGYVYSASADNTVRKISPTGTQVWSFTGHTSDVRSVAVDADGYVYSGSADNTVRKISPTGTEVWSFTGHTSGNRSVAVDADGYVYSASADNTVRKISPTGTEVWSFTGHPSTVYAVAVDPAGYVYSGSADNTVRKISPTGTQVWSFTGHTGSVYGLSVSPGTAGAFPSNW